MYIFTDISLYSLYIFNSYAFALVIKRPNIRTFMPTALKKTLLRLFEFSSDRAPASGDTGSPLNR